MAPVSRARVAASEAYRTGSPAANGMSTTAVIKAVVDSGPTESWREEPTNA